MSEAEKTSARRGRINNLVAAIDHLKREKGPSKSLTEAAQKLNEAWWATERVSEMLIEDAEELVDAVKRQ